MSPSPPHGPGPTRGVSGPWVVRRRVASPSGRPRPETVPDAARIGSLADRLAATGEVMLSAVARRVAAELDATARRAGAGREGP